jgi:hypothetical protein|tara:strand:- start:227 stop:445 length:219 start_codon:yes stop_codon:yes gene_type:complete
MPNMLRLLIILILALIAVNCSGNKKSDIYNAIDFRSIDPGTLAKGKAVYNNISAYYHNYGTAGAATMIEFPT